MMIHFMSKRDTPLVEADAMAILGMSAEAYRAAVAERRLGFSIRLADDPADRLAFHRDVLQFRNCLLVEQPNGDFACTMARQWLFSTFQGMFLERLALSCEPRLAEIAVKAVKEVRYHVELSADWVIRLGDGTDESRRRMIDGLDWHWRFVGELFQMDPIETELAANCDTSGRTRIEMRPSDRT